MDAAENVAFLQDVTGFGDLVETGFEVQDVILLYTATTEVANDFANDSGVAVGQETGAFGPEF